MKGKLLDSFGVVAASVHTLEGAVATEGSVERKKRHNKETNMFGVAALSVQ